MTEASIAVNPKQLEIITSREFDAPRERLFRAYTHPILIAAWWGPSFQTMNVEQMDVRVGGTWRFVQQDNEGVEYVFSGVYQEIKEPERLVYSFEYKSIKGPVFFDTVTFRKITSRKSELISVLRFNSLENLELMLASGIEDGVLESHALLAKLVEANGVSDKV